jgi:hypothetical protein
LEDGEILMPKKDASTFEALRALALAALNDNICVFPLQTLLADDENVVMMF